MPNKIANSTDLTCTTEDSWDEYITVFQVGITTSESVDKTFHSGEDKQIGCVVQIVQWDKPMVHGVLQAEQSEWTWRVEPTPEFMAVIGITTNQLLQLMREELGQVNAIDPGFVFEVYPSNATSDPN